MTSIASLYANPQETDDEINGLTQAEAEARYVPGQDNSITFKHGRSKKEIVLSALFNVYTFDLVAVAVVFWLLNQPVSAFLSMLIMALIFAYNISQAFQARDGLDALLKLTRPEASVIRDDKLRAIDPNEIVRGDVVVVGPGDQVFTDGLLLSDDPISVNESWITRNPEPRSLEQGDAVLGGSYCLTGHGLYEVDAVGEDRQVTAVLDNLDTTAKPKTPLEKIIYRVLAGLRILVLILGAYIVLRFLFFENDPGQRGIYESALSIILGLAPGGIYFMILLSYISGTSQLAKSGALIRREESVETLAQTDILCLGKAGTLTGTLVDFEALEKSEEEESFSESHVQHILGDFARSTRSRSKLVLAMKESFDGSKREVDEDALYLSIAGWQGIIFSDDDLEGSFILGFESALADNLDWAQSIDLDESVAGDAAEKSGQEAEDWRTLSNRAVKHFLFAYTPQLEPLHHRNGRPRLPESLIPLGYLRFSEGVRPEAQQTTSAFLNSDIALKVISSDKVERVLEAATEAGLSNRDGSPPDTLSGPQLAQLSAEAYTDAAASVEVFGLLTAEQKGGIVDSLKQQGALVTMVGDSVMDLIAQQEANLSIAFRDSSQAALSMADVILMDDTLSGLPAALETGQRIFNRLIDVLELTLTHAMTAVLLTIVALISGARYFPYLPAHNTAITLITITLPSIGLSYWLGPGAVRTKDLGRRLAFFILPAGITIALLVLGTYVMVGQLNGSNAYARIVSTHLLVGSGLLLVIFAQPPNEFWVGGDVLSGDRRPAMLAIALWFLFILLTIAPFTSRMLNLSTLRSPEHYLWVMVLLAVWVLVLRALWRADWFRRLTGIAGLDEDIPPWLS
jgi:cation-transporting ATPase E